MVRTCFIVTLSLLCAATPLQAGYVFLKNGYILQGQVTEKDESGVVLTYPGGQVTVERRYIKHVVLDPSEEALHEARRKADEAGPTVARTSRVERHVALLELPEHLSEILPPPPSSGSTSDPTPADPGTVLVPDVTVVTPPPADPQVEPTPTTATDPVEVVVARRMLSERSSMALPAEWASESSPDGASTVRVDRDKSMPSITLRSFGAEGVSLERAGEALRASIARRFPGATVSQPNERRIADSDAMAVVGLIEESGVSFEQILVQRDEGLYLIGLQWTRDTDDAVIARLKQSLDSLEFQR